MVVQVNIRTLLAAILICSLTEYAASVEYCEGTSSPKWHKFAGNCYLFSVNSQNRMSYYDAEDLCRSKGSHLLSIHSEDENQFIMQTLNKSYYYGRIWIGLNSLQGPDELQWSDDTAVNYRNIIPKKQYKKESCYIIYGKEGGWRPEHCSLHYTPICKRSESDATPTPLPPLTTPTIKGNCPVDWIQFGQRCFKFFGADENNRKTFKDALTACKGLGENYDLASVHSMEEQAFLIQKMPELGVSPWIGFRYVESDEIGHDMVFGWTDNSRTDFTFWAKGHPPRGTWKYCTRLSYEGIGKGEWIADYCEMNTVKHGYICEGPPKTSAPVPTPKPTTCDPDSVGYRDSCYRFFAQPQNWEQAEETCQNHDGHLVSLVDDFEQYFLYNYLESYFGPVWIGLKTVPDTRILGWSDKQPVYHANWNQGQPLLDPTSTSCTSMSKTDNLQWNITECLTPLAFVCKFTKVLPKPFPTHLIGSCPSTESTWIDIGDNYCYHVAQDKYKVITWGDGSRYCLSKGMEMITLHSEHQMMTLLPYLWKTKYNLWLGLIRSFEKDKFIWTDGSVSDYSNWANGEPSTWSLGRKEDCVSVSMMNSKWYPTSCGEWCENVCRVKKIINGKNVRSIHSDGTIAKAPAVAPTSQLNEKKSSNGSLVNIFTASIACVGLSVLSVTTAFYVLRRKQNQRYQDSLMIQRIQNPASESAIELEETVPKY